MLKEFTVLIYTVLLDQLLDTSRNLKNNKIATQPLLSYHQFRKKEKTEQSFNLQCCAMTVMTA